MGSLFKSKSSTSVRVPPPSAAEKKMSKFFQEQILPSFLEEAGYAVEESSEPKYITKTVRVPGQPGRHGIGQSADTYREEKVLNPKWSPTTVRKKASPEVESIREKYGADSEEYKSAYEEYTKENIELDNMKRESIKAFQKNSLDFLNGELALSKAQEQEIKQTMAPIREVVSSMFGEVGEDATFDDFYQSLQKQTETYDKVERELVNMGIQDASREAIAQVGQKAASTGRDPADPEFQAQIGEMVAREAKKGELELQRSQMERKDRTRQEFLGLKQTQLDVEQQAASLRQGMRQERISPQGIQGVELQGALKQQSLKNLMAAGGSYEQAAGSLRQGRLSQRSQTTTSTPSTGSILLGAGSAAGQIFSDRRLKKNIIKLGKSYFKDVPSYSFEYKDESMGLGRFIGVMAQDLLEIDPCHPAVVRLKEGLAVDYSLLETVGV